MEALDLTAIPVAGPCCMGGGEEACSWKPLITVVVVGEGMDLEGRGGGEGEEDEAPLTLTPTARIHRVEEAG